MASPEAKTVFSEGEPLPPVSIFSSLKKPCILVAAAVNYVALLCYKNAIIDSTSNSAIQFASSFALLSLSYCAAFAFLLHYEYLELQHLASSSGQGILETIVDPTRTIEQLKLSVHENVLESMAWAALYAAFALLTDVCFEEIGADDGMELVWIQFGTVFAFSYGVVGFSRLSDLVFKSICGILCCVYCCWKMCSKRKGIAFDTDIFEMARHNSDVGLNFLLTSVIAWLVAVKWNAAMAHTLIPSNESVSAAWKCMISWIVCLVSTGLALMLLYVHRWVLSQLKMEQGTKKIEMMAARADGKKKKRPSTRDCIINLTDQIIVFVALYSLISVIFQLLVYAQHSS